MKKPKTCALIIQAKADVCGAPATCTVVWPDDDRSHACDDCALLASEIARQHGTALKVERLK